MSGLEMFLWFLFAIVVIAAIAAAAGIALLLWLAAKAEAHAQPERDAEPFEPAAAETPDHLGADIQPDGSPAVQRSRLWPPSLRLREDYIEAAESAYNWTAAEADATKRRSR